MPKSVTIPVVVSIIALFVYFTIYRNANPPLTTPAYVTFTLDVFNFCTIVALFIILSLHETDDGRGFWQSDADEYSNGRGGTADQPGLFGEKHLGYHDPENRVVIPI